MNPLRQIIAQNHYQEVLDWTTIWPIFRLSTDKFSSKCRLHARFIYPWATTMGGRSQSNKWREANKRGGLSERTLRGQLTIELNQLTHSTSWEGERECIGDVVRVLVQKRKEFVWIISFFNMAPICPGFASVFMVTRSRHYIEGGVKLLFTSKKNYTLKKYTTLI